MASTTRGRLVSVNQTVFDQADYFESDGFTRSAGLTLVDVTYQVFYNNVLQPWTMVDGASVSDSQVSSGYIYFNEITGTSGNYAVRWRPNATGYWRLLISYTAGEQIMAQDYDVTDDPIQIQGGLNASTVHC